MAPVQPQIAMVEQMDPTPNSPSTDTRASAPRQAGRRQIDPVYVFLHIPKTAGTSLVQMMKQQLPPGEYLDLYGVNRTTDVLVRDLAALSPERKAKIRFAAGHQVWYGIHEALGRPARYITFLRSPVARVLSCYRMMRRDPTNGFHAAIHRSCPTFGQYVSSPSHPLVSNHMAVMLARRGAAADHNADDCWRVNRSWLDRADANLANFWFVGMQESYEADCRSLCDKMGVSYTPLHERRASDEPPDALEITTDDVLKCRELNWADAALYELAVIRRGLTGEVR